MIVVVCVMITGRKLLSSRSVWPLVEGLLLEMKMSSGKSFGKFMPRWYHVALCELKLLEGRDVQIAYRTQSTINNTSIFKPCNCYYTLHVKILSETVPGSCCAGDVT